MNADLPLETANEILGSSNHESPTYDDIILECISNLCSCSTMDVNNPDLSCPMIDGQGASSSTFHVDALRAALNEKEKDLELAAKIGKHLLERNKELQASNEYLEDQITMANEQVTQLKHELQRKIDLLQSFNENESESGGSTPASERRFYSWNLLEKKLSMLEEENAGLKLEINHLRCLTESLAAREAQIIGDCDKKAAETSTQIKELSTRLIENADALVAKTEHLEQNRKDIIEKITINRQLTVENEELAMHFIAAQETQKELAQELSDLSDRYAEVMAMLSETRLELKSSQENYSKFRFFPLNDTGDSLASEIEEATAQSGLSHSFKCGVKKRAARSTGLICSHLSSVDPCSMVPQTSRDILTTDRSEPPQSCAPLNICTNFGQPSFNLTWKKDKTSDRILPEQFDQDRTLKIGTETSSDESDQNIDLLEPGTPGMPGSKDLHNALKRLTLRKRIEAEYQRYKVKLKNVSSNSDWWSLSTDLHSATSSHHHNPASQQLAPRQPQLVYPPQREAAPPTPRTTVKRLGGKKCLLVKPVRGSEALDQWRWLATPTFDFAICQPIIERHGVKSKLDWSLHQQQTPPTFFHFGRGGLDSGINSDVESTTSSSMAGFSSRGVDDRCCPTAVTYSYVTSHVTTLRPFYASPINDVMKGLEFSVATLPNTSKAICRRDNATTAPFWNFVKKPTCTTHKMLDRTTTTTGLLELVDRSEDGARIDPPVKCNEISGTCDDRCNVKDGVLSRYCTEL